MPWANACKAGVAIADEVKMMRSCQPGEMRTRRSRPRPGSRIPAFAAVPLLLALPGLSITDAYFEAMSDITTTGAAVAVAALYLFGSGVYTDS